MSSTVGVTDRVYREIRDLLRSGDVVPGQRLPNERKLAEMKGASRTQVRDALLMLQKEGLVERKIGSGTYLSERAPQLIELADAAVHMSPERAHGFHETLEARLLIEPSVAAAPPDRLPPEFARTSTPRWNGSWPRLRGFSSRRTSTASRDSTMRRPATISCAGPSTRSWPRAAPTSSTAGPTRRRCQPRPQAFPRPSVQDCGCDHVPGS